MKNVITTKDLGTLNELMIFEQWASTKFKMLYDLTSDKELKMFFKQVSLSHGKRKEELYKYLKTNSTENTQGGN